ncbi:MAG TPA: amidohydrolase family protein [Candidatus Binataceae bacterium]|nr:amidohydrolase family protein [Candidatus Binataceae bacterium]
MRVWDADAHVEEWDGTFSERHFDPTMFDRRPMVIQSQRALHWMCDGEIVMPKYVGGEMDRFFGTPHSLNGKRVNTLTKKSESLEALEMRGAKDRLKLMDEEGIELSVLYPTLFLIWPIARDPVLGDACARSYNNWLCEVCSEAPERLKWVSIVDPADPHLAAAEIERTKKMGAAGTMVLGMVGTRAVTDPHFGAIWDAAGQVDMPMSVHVGECTPLGYLAFHQSLLMAFWRFAFTGVLDKYPQLHVSFLEAGSMWVPYLLGRLEDLTHGQRFATIKNPDRPERLPSRLIGVGGLAANDAPWPELTPEEYIKRGNIFFGFEVEDKLLPWCIEEYGADCWLFGSDIPHYDRLKYAARTFEARGDISEQNKRKLLCENTARFYKWPLPK